MFALILTLVACGGRPDLLVERVPPDVEVAGLNLRASLMLADDPERAAPSVLAFTQASARWHADLHSRDATLAHALLERRIAALADLPLPPEPTEACAGLPTASARAREHVLLSAAPALQAARDCADLPTPPPDGCAGALAKAQGAFLGQLGLWLRFLPSAETEAVVSGPWFDGWTGLPAPSGARQ